MGLRLRIYTLTIFDNSVRIAQASSRVHFDQYHEWCKSVVARDRAFIHGYFQMTEKIVNTSEFICIALQVKKNINWSAFSQSHWSNFLNYKIKFS